MVTEQDLIDLIKKDSSSKDFYKACELKLNKLNNEPQKISINKNNSLILYKWKLGT